MPDTDFDAQFEKSLETDELANIPIKKPVKQQTPEERLAKQVYEKLKPNLWRG